MISDPSPEPRSVQELYFEAVAVGSGNLFLTSYEPGDGELIPVAERSAAAAEVPSSAAEDLP